MAGGGSGKIGYALQLNGATLNPLDATTYFIGAHSAPNVLEGVTRVYIPKSGTIKRIYVAFTNGVVGSNETSTINLRLNNTTDTVISNSVVNNAGNTLVNNNALSISVSVGDYIELKWVTPTWVTTNPTNVIIASVVYIE